MKDFKGTEGKWYSEFYELPLFSPNGHSIIKAGGVGTPVAIVPMPIGGVNSKERNIANANLIAAAPDLLEALIGILDYEDRMADKGTPVLGTGHKNKAKRAVKKALE